MKISILVSYSYSYETTEAIQAYGAGVIKVIRTNQAYHLFHNIEIIDNNIVNAEFPIIAYKLRSICVQRNQRFQEDSIKIETSYT